MTRCVLDTNVVVSALLWRGPPHDLFDRRLGKEVIFLSSPPLFAELADVLSRKKLQHRIAVSQLVVDEILRIYTESVLSVRPRSVPRIAPDPDDDVVIGTALAANADLIVTGDVALLSVQSYHDIRIVSVADALREIS